MRRVTIFIVVFLSLSLRCSADFSSTVFLKSTIYYEDSSTVGYIKLYENNLEPFYQDLIINNFKNSDSILLKLIKKFNRIDIHEYVTSIPMHIDSISYNLKYVSDENIWRIETKIIKRIQVLDFFIQNDNAAYYIRSLLTKNEFWRHSNIKNMHTINEWGYGGDCGGTVFDYSDTSENALLVDKLNLLRSEYYTVEKNSQRIK